jgi:hypothetical protein
LISALVVSFGAVSLPASEASPRPASAHLRSPLRPAPPSPQAAAEAIADRPDAFSSSHPQPKLSPAALPSGTWQALGPAAIGPNYLAGGGIYGGVNSGRVTAVAVVPSGTHAGRTVVGTAGGGVWTSDDNGTTWSARTDDAASLAIGSVADDPSNADHLIAGTGEASQSGDSYPGFGILSSTDGGQTWTEQNPGGVFTGDEIAAVVVDPSNGNRMFAATNAGLYVTTNGGASWAKPTDASYTAVDGNVTAVVIDPSHPATVYLGGGAATVAKSADSGVHWAAANTGITAPSGGLPFIALALAPSSPTTLYASVGSTDPVALYKTTNAGANWNPLAAAPDYTSGAYAYGSGPGDQGWYDNVLAVDPANAAHVLAAGITVVESSNGGASWTNVNGQAFFDGGTNLLHPDIHALCFRSDGRAWIGTDGGVFLYQPSGPTVTNANGNLSITQFYFGFSVVGSTVLAGSQDNGSARTGSSSLGAWTGILPGDGGPTAITPNHTATQFVESDRALLRTNTAFASDAVDITPLVGGVPQFGLFTPPMIVVPNLADPSNPIAFYGGPDLYRSTNPSVDFPMWQQVTSGNQDVSAIASSPSNPLVIYVGFTNGVVQVSTNGGTTFSSLAAEPFTDTFVTGLSVDPSNAHAITASFSFDATRHSLGFPHVAQYSWTTTPSSGAWDTITGDLPATGAVSRVVYDQGALIAATDAGVYGTSAPAGNSTLWTKVGTGLPNVQVQDLDVESSGLYAVTHGRGAWRLGLVLPGPPSSAVASPGNGTATVKWVAPTSSGGSPITGYVVTPYLGVTAQAPRVFNTTATSAVITGLANATSYTFRVAAKSAIGTGANSGPSSAITIGTPIAPVGVRAVSRSTTAGTGALTVTYTAGANNGAPITRFTVGCASSNGGATKTAVHIGATAAPITVGGVTTAKAYTCKLRATNSRGAGPASVPSTAVTVGAPAQPAKPIASKVASGSLKVQFRAPANNGASIIRYNATCTSSNGGVTKTKTGAVGPITVTALTAGKSYACTVSATNSRGTGPASTASAAVTA